MKPNLIKYFIFIAVLLPHNIYAQMEKENNVKAYEHVCSFDDSDSAVYLVFEYQADSNYLKQIYSDYPDLSSSFISTCVKISTKKRDEEKYIYSLKSFIKDDRHICGVFPVNVSTYFDDSVIVEFLVLPNAIGGMVNGWDDELSKKIEFQFRNVIKLGLEHRQYKRTDSDWLIKHQEIFLLYSRSIYAPHHWIKYQASIFRNSGYDSIGFLALEVINLFERDKLAFEPIMYLSIELDRTLFIYGHDSTEHLTLLIGERRIKSMFTDLDESGNTKYYFPIDAFINVSGKARVLGHGNIIIENYKIPNELKDLEKVKRKFKHLPMYSEKTRFMTNSGIK